MNTNTWYMAPLAAIAILGTIGAIQAKAKMNIIDRIRKYITAELGHTNPYAYGYLKFEHSPHKIPIIKIRIHGEQLHLIAISPKMTATFGPGRISIYGSDNTLIGTPTEHHGTYATVKGHCTIDLPISINFR